MMNMKITGLQVQKASLLCFESLIEKKNDFNLNEKFRFYFNIELFSYFNVM